jgi:hypothetical protein
VVAEAQPSPQPAEVVAEAAEPAAEQLQPQPAAAPAAAAPAPAAGKLPYNEATWGDTDYIKAFNMNKADFLEIAPPLQEFKIKNYNKSG